MTDTFVQTGVLQTRLWISPESLLDGEEGTEHLANA